MGQIVCRMCQITGLALGSSGGKRVALQWKIMFATIADHERNKCECLITCNQC